MKVTVIEVQEEAWSVPRGFGSRYKRVVDDGVDVDVLQSVLRLVGYEVDVDDAASWPLKQRVEAFVYAANVHARASDNPIPRHPKPEWMPEPWGGLDGAPTVLT